MNPKRARADSVAFSVEAVVQLLAVEWSFFRIFFMKCEACIFLGCLSVESYFTVDFSKPRSFLLNSSSSDVFSFFGSTALSGNSMEEPKRYFCSGQVAKCAQSSVSVSSNCLLLKDNRTPKTVSTHLITFSGKCYRTQLGNLYAICSKLCVSHEQPKSECIIV